MKTKIKCLKNINQSSTTAQLVINQIKMAVDAGQVTWLDLGTDSDKLDGIYQEICCYENAREFSDAWQRYERNRLDLKGLKPFFEKVYAMINRGQINFKNIEPCTINDFTQLRLSYKDMDKS